MSGYRLLRIDGLQNANLYPTIQISSVRVQIFEDLRLTLTEEQVKAEASRCLGCGATTVDVNRCIGCGLCTTKCEFDAIHLSRDIPEASTMVRAEDKLKKVGPYAAKRAIKIVVNKITGDK